MVLKMAVMTVFEMVGNLDIGKVFLRVESKGFVLVERTVFLTASLEVELLVN